MLTYTDGEWGTTSTLLDDATTAEELHEQMKKLGFASSNELQCRTGILSLYRRVWQSKKKTFEYDYCCELVISGFLQLILLPKLADVFRFLQEVDAHPFQKNVTLEGISKNFMMYVEDWVKRLEHPAVDLAKSDELTKTLQQIAMILQQLMPLPQAQANGNSTGTHLTAEAKETS